MPNVWLPGAIIGVTPSHQATQVGSMAKANGGQPLAAATMPSVPHVDNAGAFLALPHAPQPAVALAHAVAGGAVNDALGPKDMVSGSTMLLSLWLPASPTLSMTLPCFLSNPLDVGSAHVRGECPWQAEACIRELNRWG